MLKRLLPLAVAGAFAAAPAVAAADIAVAVGQPELTAGVSVNVPVTVTCTVSDPTFTQSSDSVSVSISQAVNKEIAHGSGGVFGGPSMFQPLPLLFACDGTPTSVAVSVPAATDGPPFKRNKEAVVTAAASVFGSGATGFVADTGSSGPVAVRLK
jgi:hypothetical protein